MITIYQANKENELLFGKMNVDVTDVFYIGLSHTNIHPDGSGITEPSDPNYHRIRIENTASNFSASSNGIVTNLTEWAFPITSNAWEDINDWFISDSLTGGNALYYDTLAVPMSVDIHQILKFKPNSLQIKRVGV